jgi:hypothetical protein
MIWPTLCSALRSSSVLSYSFLTVFTSSRSARTLLSTSLCCTSLRRYSDSAFSRGSSCGSAMPALALRSPGPDQPPAPAELHGTQVRLIKPVGCWWTGLVEEEQGRDE